MTPAPYDGRAPDASGLPRQNLLDSPALERLAYLRERRWIRYPRAEAALTRLEILFADVPGSHRPQVLLITGPTNNGKSMIIERFRRAHPAGPSEDGEHEVIPVLVVQMPTGPAIRRLYGAILSALNAPVSPFGTIERAERLALTILPKVETRMIVIDELHNMLAGSWRQQREFLNLIRFLGNTLRIPIVALGTKEAQIALRSDDQIENRFEPLILPRWRDDHDFARLLASYEASLPLRNPGALAGDAALRRRVLERTGGLIGEIDALITAAARVALLVGRESIDQAALEAADYKGPEERRALFDAALRQGGR
ncbi:MAG: TniB family NTP-binding protein [Geminicoccaceae bacterium]